MKSLLAGTAALALCACWAASALADDAARPATDVATEFARAQTLRKAGNLPEAASALAQLMLVAPDDPRVVGEYGKVMAEEKRGDDALAFLKRAVELDSNDWTLYSALGVAYDENNDPKDAAGAYQHALALKPGEPAVLNNYGMSRLLAGDYAGAQSMFAQVQGANDPRIANNAAMLAEIEANHAPAARAPMVAAAVPAPKHTPHASAPVTTAALTPVQAPVVQAQHAPAPSSSTSASSAPASSTQAATAAPRTIVASAMANNPNVVMQAVPKDPLAGPVKPKVTASPHRVAINKAKPIANAPALRTAADTH